jgi:hypothetical protein
MKAGRFKYRILPLYQGLIFILKKFKLALKRTRYKSDSTDQIPAQISNWKKQKFTGTYRT